MVDEQDMLMWKAVAVGAWLACLLVGERLRPSAIAPPEATGGNGLRRLGRNLSLWLVNAILSPFVVVPLTAAAATGVPGWRPDGLPIWATLPIDLLVLDGFIYWWHRANHEVPLLWRFHVVHHLDRFLDVTSSVRFHFGEVLISALARAVAIIVLDIPLVSVLVFETLVLAAAAFHHSNLSLPGTLERRLAWVIVTPSIHWVHHHRDRRDTDSNYSTVLSVWDPIFGTRSRTGRTAGMAIGIEGATTDGDLISLAIRPFAESR